MSASSSTSATAAASVATAVEEEEEEEGAEEDENEQEGRDDVEEVEEVDHGVEEEEGGGQRVAVTFSTDDGNVVSVPEEVSDAIEKHDVPPRNYELEVCNSRSFATQWGVFCVSSSDTSDVRFYCKADYNCLKKDTLRKSTTVMINATRHLRDDHKLQGSRGKTQADTARDIKSYIAAAQAPASGVSRERSLELTYMRMLVRHPLPLQHSTTKEFRVRMGLASTKTFPNISRSRVKHLLFEMYDAKLENFHQSALAKALLAGLQEEMDAAQLNILYFSLDTWTCKTSGQKYFFVRRSITAQRQRHRRTRRWSAYGKSL